MARAEAVRQSVETSAGEDRLAAIQALADQNEREAVPALLAALHDSDADVRKEATELLGDRGDESIVDVLGQFLGSDKDMEVRATAAAALAKIGSPRALEVIRVALNDRDSMVGVHAVEAVANLGGEQAVTLLRDALRNENEEVQGAAATAIEELEGAEPQDIPTAVSSRAQQEDAQEKGGQDGLADRDQ
jgi:HEAT repeat protein